MIIISSSDSSSTVIPVSVKKTLLRIRIDTGWKISFESTKSGVGLQFLLPGRMAKAHIKGMFFSQTPVATYSLRGSSVVSVAQAHERLM